MSYRTIEQAMTNATDLMQAGAQIVKLEGGLWLKPTIQKLFEQGIPVCAHLGLTPQAVNKLGGYRVQGKSPEQAPRLHGTGWARVLRRRLSGASNITP